MLSSLLSPVSLSQELKQFVEIYAFAQRNLLVETAMTTKLYGASSNLETLELLGDFESSGKVGVTSIELVKSGKMTSVGGAVTRNKTGERGVACGGMNGLCAE